MTTELRDDAFDDDPFDPDNLGLGWHTVETATLVRPPAALPVSFRGISVPSYRPEHDEPVTAPELVAPDVDLAPPRPEPIIGVMRAAIPLLTALRVRGEGDAYWNAATVARLEDLATLLGDRPWRPGHPRCGCRPCLEAMHALDLETLTMLAPDLDDEQRAYVFETADVFFRPLPDVSRHTQAGHFDCYVTDDGTLIILHPDGSRVVIPRA